MSTEQQRPMTEEELRELPKVVAKIRGSLNTARVLALILAAVTLITGTIAVMESSLVKFEHHQIDRLDTVDKELTGRVTKLETDEAFTRGSVQTALTGVENRLKELADLMLRHIGR